MLAACNTLEVRCAPALHKFGTIAIAPWAYFTGGHPHADPRRGDHEKRQPQRPPHHRGSMAPRRTALLLVAAVQTRARLGRLRNDERQIWNDLRRQFEASANGTRFLYEEDQRDHPPTFNVSRILQEETPAPTVKGRRTTARGAGGGSPRRTPNTGGRR